MRKSALRVWLGVFGMILLAFPLRADEASEIRQRTQERRPVISELVKAGAVAESANGYLEVRNAAVLGDKAAIVEAENRDRKAAYSAIAKATGLSVEEVARRQAQRLRGQ